jgi:hypothetical protein
MFAKGHLAITTYSVLGILSLSVITVNIKAEVSDNVTILKNAFNVTAALSKQSMANSNMTNATAMLPTIITTVNNNNDTVIPDLNATAGNITGTSRRH